MNLLDQYAGFDVILDTNLLVLRIAGELNPRMISRWARINSPDGDGDFRLLLACLGRFRGIVSTPCIMTEVSHFMEDLNGNHRMLAIEKLKSMLTTIDERHLPSAMLLAHPAMNVLGLADTGMLKLAQADSKLCLLSMDTPLVSWAQHQGLAAINFNYLRSR